MPFKLIHLACAPELPATPSIPHSLCQRSLSAGGVNVNSATAWAESLLLSQEEKMKTERKKKKMAAITEINPFFLLFFKLFLFTNQC